MTFGWVTWPLAVVIVASLGYRLLQTWFTVVTARSLTGKHFVEQQDELQRLMQRVARLEMKDD